MTSVASATDPTGVGAIVDQGRRLILDLQHPSGAYPASPDFSAYRGFSWLRDGAFIADAMSVVGEADSASRFFDWCARVIVSHEAQIRSIAAATREGRMVPSDRMLPTRFTLEGGLGDADWWDFQLDGYGTWLWAVAEHAERHGIDLQRWAYAIDLTAEYLLVSWRRPCFDWWEEHVGHVHVSTLGCIAAGLRAASEAAVLDSARRDVLASAARSVLEIIRTDGAVGGRLNKWIGSQAVDASLAALVAPLGVIDPADPIAIATLEAIETDLTVNDGVHRYLGDTYYGGGQWPLLSCILGLAHAAGGNTVRARELGEWALGTVRSSRTMPEQVEDHLLHPERREEWVERWGPSADPLLWSYAMFMRLAVVLHGPEVAK